MATRIRFQYYLVTFDYLRSCVTIILAFNIEENVIHYY